jgi:hypothetical protein
MGIFNHESRTGTTFENADGRQFRRLALANLLIIEAGSLSKPETGKCRESSDLRHEDASMSSDLKQEKKNLLLTEGPTELNNMQAPAPICGSGLLPGLIFFTCHSAMTGSGL